MSLVRAIEVALGALGRLLYHLGLARLILAIMPKAPRVVLYHSCEPEPSDFVEGLNSNTAPDAFRAHLDYYRAHYHVVPVERLTAGGRPPRALVITFDDGYRSVFDHAFPLLRAAGLPAVVYLVTDVLEPGRLVWVNELNWWLHRHPDVARRHVSRAFDLPADLPAAPMIDRVRASYDPERVRALLAGIRAEAGPAAVAECLEAPLYLNWTQIRDMTAGGIRFGAHTVTHPNLTRLPGLEVKREVGMAREYIAGRLGSCDSLAYPFGDVDRGCRAAAVEAGYGTLMEVGGVNWPWDPHRVARVPVSATTAAQLFAELEVVAPLKGVMRRLFRR
jgi:peptidoglycan/xylan/chitin deacetylase (PgdA/CDA1 family)